MKKIIVFDLDGTLAQSKSAIDSEMGKLLEDLLRAQKVAIISGGDWPQFQKQVLERLPKGSDLENLLILPTSGTKFYTCEGDWKQLYAENFTEEEKKRILDNLERGVEESGLKIEEIWGEQIEDRGSQITFSALGQKAPLDAKKDWDPDMTKRKKIVELIKEPLKEFSIGMGGTTSIDIVKRGIDKAYGIQKLEKILDIDVAEMFFIGDKLMKGGNDYPIRRTGIDWVEVRDVEETKKIIKVVIAYCATDTKNKTL